MRSARAYRDEYEPHRPPSVTDLPLFATQTPGEVARDRVLAGFEAHRATVVAALRAEAHRLYRVLGRALSANDVRPVLARFPGVDARILVTAFRGWEIVGETTTTAPKNHARRIRTFVPRETR